MKTPIFYRHFVLASLLLLAFVNKAHSQASIVLQPNTGNTGNLLIKSTGPTYGNLSTTAANGAIVLRVNEPTNGNGSTGTITGAIDSYVDFTRFAGYTNAVELYGINSVRIGTNANPWRMIMNSDGGVGINPVTNTDATQAKLWVNGAGPVQSLSNSSFGYGGSLNHRMGIKAVVAPTNGTKTGAIVGISSYQYGTPTQETGEASGVIGFSDSKTISYGVQGISAAYGSGGASYGVYGSAYAISGNSNIYGGRFTTYMDGGANSNNYGVYASANSSGSVSTGNGYGGYFSLNTPVTGERVGVMSEVDNSYTLSNAANKATGFRANISGVNAVNTKGLHINMTPTMLPGGQSYGALLDMFGTTTNGNYQYGLRVNVKASGGASDRYGIYADVDGSTWNNSYGIFATSKIVSAAGVGTGLKTYGGYFVATGSSPAQFGIYATSDANAGPNVRYAGYFDGNVAVIGNLTKSSGTFKIDHPQDPENKFLYHSFVESPDMKNIYDGTITTNADGEATVEMPHYFESLNKDFRYQLTSIGQFAQAIVAEEISNNQFRIKTDKPNVKISWQVTGIRKDAYAEANRVVVEVDKKGEEKGKYLHPEVFGKEKTQGMSANHAPKSEPHQ